jgi:hypothetical protein
MTNASVVSRAFRYATWATLVSHHGAAAAGVFRPALHARLQEGAVNDQLTAAVEEVEQAHLTRIRERGYGGSDLEIGVSDGDRTRDIRSHSRKGH